MDIDLKKLSDKDLDALLNNDLASMSDVGLSIISGEAPKLASPRKTTAREDVQASLVLTSQNPMLNLAVIF